MAEEAQGSSTEQTTSTEGNEQTLEQVYEKFNVEEHASEFHPQQQPQQRVEQQQPQHQQPPLGAEIPDPVLDQAGFKSYLAKQDSTVKQTLAGLSQFQQQLYVQEQRRREEADIRSAVQTVKEKIGDIDDDFVEIALGQKARKDPKFLSIYQNRGKNPGAWKAALGAVANEFKGKYQFRQDSQLTENVRAAKQSTQSSLTAKESASNNPIEQKLAEAKTDAEFQRYWDTFKSQGM